MSDKFIDHRQLANKLLIKGLPTRLEQEGETLRPFSRQKQKNKWYSEDKEAEH